MKKIVTIAAMYFLTVSCETESLVVKNSDADNLSAHQELTGKILRMSQYATAIDNLVDGTSCFAVQFPYRVWVNNQLVSLTGPGDYQLVRDILEANGNNPDTVTLQFPVTVKYADYTESVLAGQAAFQAAVSGCLATDELSCIALRFPLEIKSYNLQNQSAETIRLQNNKALHGFLDKADGKIAAFDYPVRLITPGGASLAIQDNMELEAFIDTYVAECSTLLNPGPDPVLSLEEIITEGTWYISYFFRENDQTSAYIPYDFTFQQGGTSSVTGEPVIIGGTWVTYNDNGQKHIVFVFGSDNLEELEESWFITDFTPTLIKMRYESGGSGTRYLHLTRN